jgi:serine/threonine-protein kinase
MSDDARGDGSAPSLVGRLLGRFRIVSELGRGGMGIVYVARDETLRRDVALKVLPHEEAQHQERRRRFLREARSAAAVMHPCVAAIFDVGEADGSAFIAMELVDGRTLRALLRDDPPSLPRAIAIARQVLQGLGKAHEKGIVHRDLKPDNIMVDAEGRVKILDFGVAKALGADDPALADVPGAAPSRVTKQGQILGTPAYMSPEQARGGAIDQRSDLFSFGIVLYEVLAGERPFVGTGLELLMRVALDEPRALRSVRPDVPEALAALVARCMKKQPAERYASADEVLADLDAMTASRDVVPPGDAPSIAAPTAPRTSEGPTTIVDVEDPPPIAASREPEPTHVSAAPAAPLAAAIPATLASSPIATPSAVAARASDAGGVRRRRGGALVLIAAGAVALLAAATFVVLRSEPEEGKDHATAPRTAASASAIHAPAPPGDPCACSSWKAQHFSIRVGADLVCRDEDECIATFHLRDGQCAVTKQRPWCFVRPACPLAQKSDDRLRWFRYCD